MFLLYPLFTRAENNWNSFQAPWLPSGWLTRRWTASPSCCWPAPTSWPTSGSSSDPPSNSTAPSRSGGRGRNLVGKWREKKFSGRENEVFADFYDSQKKRIKCHGETKSKDMEENSMRVDPFCLFFSFYESDTVSRRIKNSMFVPVHFPFCFLPSIGFVKGKEKTRWRKLDEFSNWNTAADTFSIIFLYLID